MTVSRGAPDPAPASAGRVGIRLFRAVLVAGLVFALGFAARQLSPGEPRPPTVSAPCIETMRERLAVSPSPSEDRPGARWDDASSTTRCPQAGDRMILRAAERGMFCNAHGLVATPGPKAFGIPFLGPATGADADAATAIHRANAFDAAVASVTRGSTEAAILAELCYEIALERETIPLVAFTLDRHGMAARARDEIRDLPDLSEVAVLRERHLAFEARVKALASPEAGAVHPDFGQYAARLAAHRARLLGLLGNAGSNRRKADAAGLVLLALVVLGYSIEPAGFPFAGSRTRIGLAVLGAALGLGFARALAPEVFLERLFLDPWTPWKLVWAIRITLVFAGAQLLACCAGDADEKPNSGTPKNEAPS